MSFLTAALLGLVQGITEYFPVSSSGHLALLQNVFHIADGDMMFDVMLHLGTLISLFIVYKSDVAELIRGFFCLGRNVGKHPELGLSKRLASLIILGSLPMLLAVPLVGRVNKIAGSTVVIGILLLLNGFIIHISDQRIGRKGLKDMSLIDALLIGLGQIISVLPGISRTGITVSVAESRGLSRSYALRFSLLLSIPAFLGAAVVQMVQGGFRTEMLSLYLVGMLVSAVSGYFSLRFVKWLAARSNFGSFAYYCWGAGIVSLILSLVT